MINTNINRAVALALGLWKEGEKCDGVPVPIMFDKGICESCDATVILPEAPELPPHDIPPPDLLTPEGHLMLEVALWKRHIHVEYGIAHIILLGQSGKSIVYPIDGDIVRALRDAAYKLMCEEK